MLSSASEQTELPAAGGPSSSFHGRYLSLVACIERQFPVAGWRCEDVDLWPIARMALYLDMFWAQSGSTPPAPRAWPLRAAARLATPFTNAWKSRHDRTHCLTQATSAYAIVLGDGVCLDRVEGSWQDRFAEPLIDALDRQGKTTFVMQQGALARLPWRRPTYSVNRLAAAGSALAKLRARPVTLRGHADLLAFLASHGIPAPSLQAARLAWRARQAEAIAGLFQRTLQRVRPTLAFVVTYYAGLGAAFLAACRREHILSIDLQHCPQEGAHKAYRYDSLPAQGYSTLPALFWNWTGEDAARIDGWTHALSPPWHRSVHGGHTQLDALLDDDRPQARRARQLFATAAGGRRCAREIVLALQPMPNQWALWQEVREQIESSPADWRWWVRRHPAATPFQDRECAPVLSLDRPNVLITPASELALPTLLREADALVSIASGAALEAAALRVPALFLSPDAQGPFQTLLAQGLARIVAPASLNATLCLLAPGSQRAPQLRAAPLAQTLRHLHDMAEDYAHW